MNDLLKRTADNLEKQIASDPTIVPLWSNLAEILASLGDHQRLEELARREGYSRLPIHTRFEVIGFTARLLPSLALDMVNQILEGDKANALAYWRKAELLEILGDKAQAAKIRGVATVIHPLFETSPPSPWAISKSGVPIGTTDIGSFSQPDEDLDQELKQVEELLGSLDEDKLPKIGFKDIGGMEDLKKKIRMQIILPFEKPELFKKFKKDAGGGVLLYGPPGCGKTILARAAAGEANLYFSSLQIPEILSKWMGESEQRIHQFFENARRRAPALLFIDEIDALGAKRSDTSPAMATLVNVLLTEIDGSTSNNKNLFILAATNMPWRVDTAFRRPGRFNQTIFVAPPDLEARKTILQIHLQNLPLGLVDVEKVAKKTERFSGADLRQLITASVETAMAREMETGREEKITTDLLLQTLKTLQPTTAEWMQQAANYASYANNSGIYDELAEYLNKLH